MTRLDDIDHKIIELLRADGRLPVASIASTINLSQTATRNRITAMESSGVILGYTVRLDYDKLEGAVDAYVEVWFNGATNNHSVLGRIIDLPGVREAVNFAGRPDALLRVRTATRAELRELVGVIREFPEVTNTNTQVALGRWWHGSSRVAPDDLEDVPATA